MKHILLSYTLITEALSLPTYAFLVDDLMYVSVAKGLCLSVCLLI